MSSLRRELVCLILQFLDEENFKETAHKLEKESGVFFNMKYFEDCVTNGEWDEVDKYLSGFTKVEDNRYSMKIFFEIRKHKYLEALDKRENGKAVDILLKDLKVFSSFNEDVFKEIALLLTLGNFRENEQLSKYGDTKSARAFMLVELKKLIEANPLFRDKLQFPLLKNSRLRTLINQSLNWQHHLCKNPRPNPDMRTLFVDHSCGPPFDHLLMGAIPRVGGFPAGAHGPFQHAPTPLTTPLAGWTRIPSSMPHQAVSAGPIGPIGIAASSEAVSVRKRSRTPSTKNPTTGYQTADSEHVLKRSRPGMPDEVNNLPDAYPGQSFAQSAYSSDDLPKNVVVNLNQGSVVKSMDFHPVQQTLLLVGTNIGDITIWEVGSRERLVFQNFKVWDLSVCSVSLQASLTSEYNISVNSVTWNSDGTFFGVAYSRNIVRIYSYLGGSDLRNHLEIEAHSGNVSDIAFSQLPEQLCVVTCGEDRTVKVWDAITGNMQYTFEGHAAPVYSVCPHHKEHVQFIFSTSVDGKIKTWLYDNAGSRVDYDTPGLSCTTMAYSSDGTRLFSCGTNREGESFLVEWNEIEGAIKRMYLGLGKESVDVVQFDTTRNQFLAAGDEFRIKFWDMENVNMMTFTDADGGLMASPCLRFNKEGMLLAVSTNENGIKILANVAGARLLRSIESRALDAARATSGAIANGPIIGAIGASSSTTGNSSGVGDRSGPMSGVVGLNGNSRIQPNVKPSIVDDNSKIWKLNEITEPSQIRSLRLPDSMLPVKVNRLMYTNSGDAILALAYNAVHKLWKWSKKEQNPSGKATSNIPPKLWQPLSGIQMANDIGDNNVEDAVPCLALSNNDAYVMSASGGKISLFNMMSFKTMATFLTPPPAATFIAFHPEDNNIIAIGMDDSSIQIYNVRFDKVQSKLKGHLKRVTGLVFSNVLNVLVSSGADAQLCVWSMDAWEKQESESLQIPAGRTPNPLAPTHIQFHKNQIHLLVAHETQIAIYVAPELECVKQWAPQESSAITDATYSCDSQSIYACFEDGTVAVLTGTTLQVKCRIYPNAYIPSNPSTKVYPVVIASHPTEPNQFAVGLTDGAVRVLEPSESEGKWGDSPPLENGGPSVSSPTASDQQPR